MNKAELKSALLEQYETAILYFEALPEADFLYAEEGKWTAGQQLLHLLKSVRPVALAMGLPALVPRLLYGKGAESRPYDDVVAAYQRSLQAGGKATKPYIPTPVAFAAQRSLVTSLRNTLAALTQRMDRYSEAKLDRIRLPHPILGRLTLREMLYFTHYHAQHHQNAVRNMLSSK